MEKNLRSFGDYLRSRKRIIGLFAPVLFGVLFMILCMPQLHQSLGADESYSAYLTRFEPAKIYELSAQNSQPPLYYFALKVWAHFFGHTDFAMRMLSVICGATAILFAYLWLRYKHGLAAAITAASLLALSPTLVHFGQTMAAPAMAIAIVFAASYVLQLAINNRKIWWLIYGILLVAGIYTNYCCALAWLAHIVYLALVFRKKIFQKSIIVAFLASAVACAPCYINRFQYGIKEAELSAQSLADYWARTLIYQDSGMLKNWLLVLAIAASVFLIVLIVRTHRQSKMLLSLAIVPLLAQTLLSLPPLQSISSPERIAFSMAAISLVSGISLVLLARQKLPKRNRAVRKKRAAIIVLSSLLFFATNICGLVNVYLLGNYNFQTVSKSSGRELYEMIAALDAGRSLATICASESLYLELSSYTTKEHSVYFMNETAAYNNAATFPLRDSAIGRIDNLDAFIAKRDSFWFLTTLNRETNELASNFPREGWRTEEYTTTRFDGDNSVYAIVKMMKE